jgi:NADH-quinone oxidoreductase subunit N
MTDLGRVLPEITLALLLALVVVAEITYHGERLRLLGTTVVLGLAAVFFQVLVLYSEEPALVFGGALAIDGLSLFFKMAAVCLSALVSICAVQTREIPLSRRAEFLALVVASALATSLAASATDLLLVFCSLQAVNVISYLLSGFAKGSVRSTEAAVKYLVLSGVAGVMLLYGMALLFASTHSLNIHEIHKALAAQPLPPAQMLTAFLLIFVALSFQLAVFPMHPWAPDVLEGAPTPASSFLSLAPRLAGAAVAVRLCVVLFALPAAEGASHWRVLGDVDWTRILAFAAGASLLAGPLLAYRQTAAKRLVGSLVVAQGGFLLLGLLVLNPVGVAALLFNLLVELFALMGIFAVLSHFHDLVRSDRLEDLRGLLGRAIPESVALILFLACLVGLPPLPGFIGKFALIGAVIREREWILAGIAIFSMALSAVAATRLCRSLAGGIGGAPLRVAPESGGGDARARHAFLLSVAVPMFLLAIFAEALLQLAGRSLRSIFW